RQASTPSRESMLLRSLMCLLFAASVPGCLVNLGTPTGAMVECSTNADCPKGTRCSATSQQCVPLDQTDLQAPGVLSAALSGAFAGVGSEGVATPVLRTLVVVEELAGQSRVYFVDEAGEHVFAGLAWEQRQSDGAFEYRASYQPTGTEPEAT